jgi:hypothetical protein
MLQRRLVGDEPVELLWPASWMQNGLELTLEGGEKLELSQLQLGALQAAMAERRLLLLMQSQYLGTPKQQERKVRRELRLDASWPNRQERLEHIFRRFCESPVCKVGPQGSKRKRGQALRQQTVGLDGRHLE